jgi:hypothetical protein
MNFGAEQEFLKTQHVRVQGAEAAENPGPLREGMGGCKDVLVARDVWQMSGQEEPVRIPREVLEELESVRRYTHPEVLDIPTVRPMAMETEKPALVVWIDKHEQEYGQGLLNGFRAEE